MAEQQRDFGGALAQRRNENRENIETIVEVFAEAAGLHGFLNVHVGGGENAHVCFDHVASTEARVLMILEDVEKLGLEVRAHLGDFVEEDRALVGEFAFTGLGAVSSGEGALFESEEFRFEEFAGESGAVHFDEGLVAALGAKVNHARDDFFADAAFTADEDGNIDRRDLQNLLADANHLRAGSEEAEILGDLIAVIAERLLFLARLEHRSIKIALFERLGEVIVSADANRLDDGADFVGAAQHDDVEAAIELKKFAQDVDAVHLWHQHVENDEIGAIAVADLGERFFAGANGFDIESVNLEQSLKILANARFVVHHENLFFNRHFRLPQIC